MDEDQRHMKFSLDDDYEDGQWIDGEFFASKKKEKRKQTREDVLYGVFNESDSDEDEARRRKRKFSVKEDLTKPVAFVSKGLVNQTEDDKPSDKKQEVKDNEGIAFSGGGLGFKPSESTKIEQEEKDDEEDEIFLTSFGKQVKERAKKRQQHQNMFKKQSSESKAVKSNLAAQNIGTFEKHTKGFGLKMLEKMGYKGGGLGKNEQGMAVPVEAKLRPKTMGMGFNDFKEKEVGLPPPPKWGEKGDEIPPQDVNLGETVGKTGGFQRSEKREKMWKKKNSGKKREYKTAEQVLMEKEESGFGVGEKIIDMRGSQVKVLTSLENLGQSGEGQVEPPPEEDETPLPELQYNLRLLVDLAEADILLTDRKLRYEQDNMVQYKEDSERTKSEALEQARQLEAMESLLRDLEDLQIQEKYNASLADLGNAVLSLSQRYSEDFRLYKVGVLAASLAVPLASQLFQGWDPLREPNRGSMEFKIWKRALSSSGGGYGEENGGPIFGDWETLQASGADPYLSLVGQSVLPYLRTSLTNRWEVRSPEPILKFLEEWTGQGLIPGPLLDHLLDHLVLPKLTLAVQSWDPLVETVPVHLWIHPWLPWMGERLQPLFQPIKYSLGKALGGFVVGDGTVLAVLAPWKKVFDSPSWEGLIGRYIVPRLAEAMAVNFVVNPRAQDLATWHNVIGAWGPVLPEHHTVALLESYFFPQWHGVLYRWLSSQNPNFEEITRWYLGWKAMIPQDLLANERVRKHLNSALQMMNQATHGAPPVPPPPPQAQPQPAPPPPPPPPSRGAGEGEGEELSLKEVVAKFAEECGVHFLPKPGRFQEGRQVYQFGSVAVCVDVARQILLANEKGDWRPLSLEGLLELHRKRGGRWGTD